jgi:hypothetical protein
LLDDVEVNDRDPADVVTDAIRVELADLTKFVETLRESEWNCDYPRVATDGRVIDDDTALVVVDESLCERLKMREKLTSRTLLQHSVQIRRKRIENPGLAETRGNRELYVWGGRYDPDFLGACLSNALRRHFGCFGGSSDPSAGADRRSWGILVRRDFRLQITRTGS